MTGYTDFKIKNTKDFSFSLHTIVYIPVKKKKCIYIKGYIERFILRSDFSLLLPRASLFSNNVKRYNI